MDSSLTPSDELPQILEFTSEFATMLTQEDSPLANEVLLARVELENAINAQSPEEHYASAKEQLELAQKLEPLNPDNYKTELTTIIEAIDNQL